MSYYWNNVSLDDLLTNDGQQNHNDIKTLYENFPDYQLSSQEYDTYNDEPAPPFFIDGSNIFTNPPGESVAGKIRVREQSYSSTDQNITIPSWCNAIKFYCRSKKGSNSNTSYPAYNATNVNNNVNEVAHHNKNVNNIFEHTNRNHNTQIHHNNNINYGPSAAVYGGNGGAGGIYYITKWIEVSGNNVIIDYTCNNTSSGSNEVKIYDGEMKKCEFSVSNGADGAPANPLVLNYNTIEKNTQQNGNNENIDHRNYELAAHTESSDGADGASGSVTVEQDPLVASYTTTHNQTTSSALYVYTFYYS